MKRSLGLAIALAIVASSSAATEDAPASKNAPVPRHHNARPTAKLPARAVESGPPDTVHRPFTPYSHPGDGDNDGLSRDPDDCNKGCIDGNPG